jgi:hypothetical protein
MKTRITIVIALTAIITLSFSFVSKKAAQQESVITTATPESVPGGFALEDAL